MSTQEMSQLVEKLNKEREDHDESIKNLTLTELREKVRKASKLKLTQTFDVESEVLHSQTENERRAPQ